MATVTINGLECGVTYDIKAGGTINGEFVGPVSPHGYINDSCSSSTQGSDGDGGNY